MVGAMRINFVDYKVTKASGEEQAWRTHNLRTNDGVNWQGAHMFSAAIAAIKNIAVTEDTTTPTSSMTNLVGELAANGMSRKTATFSQTANQSLCTLTASWQFTGSVATIARAAIAYAATDTNASSDTHFAITALSPVAVLDSNDTLEIAWGISL